MRSHLLAPLTFLVFAAAISACGDARSVAGSPLSLDCNTCHGTPPPPPHPEVGDCFDCHSATVDEQTNIKPDGGHENGQVDFAVEGASCSACHGNPPPPGISGPSTLHPQDPDCSQCHSGTVRDDDQTIIPGGGHMNGHTDVTGGHEIGFLGVHGISANANLTSCTECHGATFGGGDFARSCNACHSGIGFADWQTNCTFCHGVRTQNYTAADLPKAAPPQGVNGETATTERPVGAHQKHLGNGSLLTNGFPCETCHVVPTDLAHVNGTARAELTFGPLARIGFAAPLTPAYDGARCSNVYCHGAPGSGLQGGTVNQPTWTAPPQVLCGSCHALPPNPQDQGTQLHPFHVTTRGMDCSRCHDGYTILVTPATNKATHVNGVRNAVFAGTVINGWDCDGCHALR